MTDTTQPPAITVVGSSMRDMVAYVDPLPADGETRAGDRFEMGFGGKGANQAVMMRRLGAEVAMVNCVGDDAFGTEIVANLADEGIDVSAVTPVDGVASGVAPIWVDAAGTNRVVVVPGANLHMTTNQATRAVSQAERLDVVVGQFEIAEEITLAGFHAGRQRGAVTVLNPAPAAPIGPELLAATDVLVPNEHEFAELAAMFDIAVAADDLADPDRGDGVILAAAEQWGVAVVVTLGAAGAAVAEPGGVVIRTAAPPATAVDTTGAGDAFVGGFAVGLARGRPYSDAASLGCACGSASVTKPGTQTSYPSADEAARLLGRIDGSGAA